MIFDKFRLGKTSKEAQEIVKKRLKLGSEDVRVINYLFYKGYKNWEITEIMKVIPSVGMTERTGCIFSWKTGTRSAEIRS